jgi:hypothetical protein
MAGTDLSRRVERREKGEVPKTRGGSKKKK